MAREIVTRIWCDACLNRDPENYTEGTETPPIAIGNAKPRVLALCDVDMKEIYEPLKTALAEMGQMLPGPGAAGASIPKSGIIGQSARRAPAEGIDCPLSCGSVLSTRDSLNGHTTRVHDKTLNEILIEMNIDTLYDVNGVEVPGPRAEKVPEDRELACDQPDCGKVYTYPKYRRPKHALSVHLSQVHGITKADREKAAAAEVEQAAKKPAKKAS